MLGLLIGLACGAGELYLLTRLMKALSEGKSLKMLGIFLVKVLLFAAALVPVSLYFRGDIIWCGVGISSVLIVGAVIINLRLRKGGKGDR